MEKGAIELIYRLVVSYPWTRKTLELPALWGWEVFDKASRPIHAKASPSQFSRAVYCLLSQ